MKKLAALFLLAACTSAHSPAATVKQIAVGGNGGWDYLAIDEGSQRLFASHSDRVEVVDLGSRRVVGQIPKTEGVHGIAIAPDLNRGFVSNGRAGSMTIFDLHSLAPITEVKTTGDNPDAILYDAATKRVFTFNGRGKNATVFDGATGNVVATIPLGGKPEFAVSDGSRVFVNIEDTSELAVIDASTATVIRRSPLAPCEEPSGLAIDRAHHRLFSVCDNGKMVITNEESGEVVASVPIGDGVDGAAFDPGRQLAFSSNGADGTVTVVREVTPAKFEVSTTITTAKGARTIVLDEKTHHVFLPTATLGPAPAPDADHPHPRPTIVPETFEILDVAP